MERETPERMGVVVRFSLQSAPPASRARLGDGAEGGAAAQGKDAFRVETDEPTLAHLRDAFPVCGRFHFRCLVRDGHAWRDLLHDSDVLVKQDDGTCVVKALDIGALVEEVEASAGGVSPVSVDGPEAYEREMVRMEEIGAAYEQRPKVAAVDEIPSPENSGRETRTTMGAGAVKSGIESAKKIGKKLGNAVGGLFKRGR